CYARGSERARQGARCVAPPQVVDSSPRPGRFPVRPHSQPGGAAMWIPKWQRDRAKGVDSPVPTQVVSTEEFIPRPQNEQQKQVEKLTGKLAEERAKKLGVDRRAFMASSMGLAAAFLASNQVYGRHWDVEEVETFEPDATEEKWPKGDFFII